MGKVKVFTKNATICGTMESGLTKAQKLLDHWTQQLPKEGVPCEDTALVMESLSMTVTTDGQNHKKAFHQQLIGSALYPLGSFRVNCH